MADVNKYLKNNLKKIFSIAAKETIIQINSELNGGNVDMWRKIKVIIADDNVHFCKFIREYLEKYNGIKQFMDEIVERAKNNGYVETLFGRRRYIPEIKSSNYMVRQFGARVAMNTPIQGTAADIMKIAMINVYNELKQSKISARIVLQIHDELLLEVSENDKEEAKKILKNCMERAKKLVVPLQVELSEGDSWYEVK